MITEHSLRPVLVCALGVAVLASLDALMKVVAASYPIGQVVGLRYMFGAGIAVSLMVFYKEGWPSLATIKRTLLRAVIIVCTASTFFTAIARLALADAIALTFLAPLFMALLGRLILSEPIRSITWLAIGLGFAGVAVIANGHNLDADRSFDPIGISAALACAFFYALSMVLMRKQSATDSTITIVGLSNLLTLLLVSPAMIWQWQPPGQTDLLVFAGAGLLGTTGHVLMAWAYKRAQAGRLGTLEYSAFLWGSGFGYVFFNEVPTPWTIAGAVLIIVASLCAAWQKQPRMKLRTPAA